jgi:hypothetical protein
MSEIKKVLAQLNKVIVTLEKDGMDSEANVLHKEFVKISQLMTPASDPSRARRINGPEQMAKIKELQGLLKINQDGMFGPDTVKNLIMVLDGLKPDSFLKPDYVQRVQQYVAGLDQSFKNKMSKYVTMKDKFRAIEKTPATKPFLEEPSEFKLTLLKDLVGY